MAGKQVTELDTLPSFTDNSLLPVHNGAGLKKGLLSQLANYLGTKFSNPNLLINPDFRVNQRGSSTYATTSESPIYTVDRWMLSRGKATVNSDGTVTVTATGGATNEEGYFQQKLENAISDAYTVSMEVVSISGTVRIAIGGEWETVTSGKNVFQGVNSNNNFNSVGLQLAVGASITLEWVKLEQGTVATAFVAPNYADELVKCQRYYYQFSSRLIMSEYVPVYADGSIYFPTEMRTTPTLIYGECTYFSHTLGFVEPKSIGVNTSYFTTKDVLMRIERNANDKFTVGYSINAKLNIYFDAEIY